MYRPPEICPACLGRSVRKHVASRRTGHVVCACRSCGLRYLDDRAAIGAGVEADYREEFDREVYENFLAGGRTDVVHGAYRSTLGRLREMNAAVASPRLFDVGAGDGSFLTLAVDAGYEPSGNELSGGAIEMAHELHGFELLDRDLSELDLEAEADAVTMWCVLAHVADGERLLGGVARLLRPGGVLFLQTPRWSLIDVVGMALHVVSRGRWSWIVDRRLPGHHLALHTVKSLSTVLRRVGLDPVEVEPRSRYSQRTDAYLDSLGVPRPVARVVGAVLDPLVQRGWFARIVLDAYAVRRSPAGA